VEDLNRFIALLSALFPDEHQVPKQLYQARASRRVLQGEPVEVVAGETGLTKSYLRTWSSAISDGNFYRWTRRKPPTDERLARSRAGIAQMMLGFLAEAHFEGSAQHLLHSGGFSISDDRAASTDTDYRLLDAENRTVCRLNIKFHGTLFRAAKEYVGLEPEDCFALATYKISTALQRQQIEAVPYVFLVVTVPSLPRSYIEGHITEDAVWLASVSSRAIEETIARQLLTEPWAEGLKAQIERAQFRVISASRAHRLLHEKLFERVFALRVKAFNWTFRGAEIDMHLSLNSEMILFSEFGDNITQRGVREVAIRLDRGEI